MNKRVIVLFLAAYISNSLQTEENICTEKLAMPDFKMDKFLGKWYIVKDSMTSSNCNTHVYTKSNTSTDSYLLEENNIEIDQSHVEGGSQNLISLTSTKDKPAFIKRNVSWIFDTKILIVFATDYDNYAGVFMCNPEPVKYHGFITETYIYSRKEQIDAKLLTDVQDKMKTLGIVPEKFRVVDHSLCAGARMAPSKWDAFL